MFMGDVPYQRRSKLVQGYGASLFLYTTEYAYRFAGGRGERRVHDSTNRWQHCHGINGWFAL